MIDARDREASLEMISLKSIVVVPFEPILTALAGT